VAGPFRHLFANGLASGGVYIVEDIHANYWKAFRDNPMSSVDFTNAKASYKT
jgi:hypothetical protein